MPARLNFSAISPFGPIFGKELRTTARRKRSYFLRVGYLGILLLVLIMVWSAFSMSGYGSGVAWRQQQQAQLGEAFFITFSLFCVGAMGLIGPVLTATAVSSERLQRTLHVLLMTPINNWQIVSGKLLSRMLIALTLIGLSLPVLALVRLLGGVELTQMFGAICLAFVTALTGASIGLLFSTMLKRGYAVILLSYGVMGFVYVFLPMVGVFAAIELDIPEREWARLFTTLNPFLNAGLLTQGRGMQYASWEWCVLVHVIISAVLLMWSAVLLRRLARRENEGAPVAAPPLPVAMPRMEGETPGFPDAPPALPPVPMQIETRTVSNNPVLWRELRQPLMSRRWQRVTCAIICVGLLLVTYAMLAAADELEDRESQAGYATIFHALIALIACVFSATAIAQEKEGDTWTLLLTTSLKGHEIILGKFLGILRRMIWPMLLIVGHFGLFLLTGVISFSDFWSAIWMIITSNLLWIATGILLSLCIRKATFAVVLNLMLPVLIYGGIPMVLLIIGELAYNSEDLAEITVYYLPFFYLIERLSNNSLYYDGTHRMPSGTYFSPHDFLLLIFAVGCGYVVLTGVVIRYTIAMFDRIVGRCPQK